MIVSKLTMLDEVGCIPQSISSDPSMQSSIESHFCHCGMHWTFVLLVPPEPSAGRPDDRHLNWLLGQVATAVYIYYTYTTVVIE